MYITAQGCCLRNDLYCVEWDVKLYYTIPFVKMASVVPDAFEVAVDVELSTRCVRHDRQRIN